MFVQVIFLIRQKKSKDLFYFLRIPVLQYKFMLNALCCKGGLTQLYAFFVSLSNDIDETLEIGIKLFSLPEALCVSSVLCNNCLMSHRAACAHKHLFAESW